jgi:hypothetical protein
MRRFTWLMLLLLMSCQQAVQPPTIRYGEDACANCRMLINEAPYACAIETETGEVRKYDDFNCMFLDSERVKPMRYWVHHHDKPDQWLDGEKAFYVRADALQTRWAVAPSPSPPVKRRTARRSSSKARSFPSKPFAYSSYPPNRGRKGGLRGVYSFW